MITDTFYHILTLTITVLACFIWKKSGIFFGVCTQTFNKASSWTPQTSGCNCFWLHQKPMCPYFFCIIPCLCMIFWEKCFLCYIPHEKINQCLTDIKQYLTSTENQFYKVSVILAKHQLCIGLYQLYQLIISLLKFLP